METEWIQITESDIQSAQEHDWEDPIANALARVTGSLWLACDIAVILEASPPYRTVVLHGDVYTRWCQYKATGIMDPFEFEAELTLRNRPRVAKSA